MIATKEIDFFCLCQEIFVTGCNLRFPFQGGSMSPTIKAKDFIVCKPVTCVDISPGDIVLYHAGSNLVAHRLIKIDRSYDKAKLVTKGDASNREDSPIAPEQILAKVIAIEKPNGTIRLDDKLGKTVNYLIATHLYITYLICKTSHLAERNITGSKNNGIKVFGYKALLLSLSLFPKLLINFLCFRGCPTIQNRKKKKGK